MTMQMQRWTPPTGVGVREVGSVVCGFLDVVSTSMGRETHYNTLDAQQAAEIASHQRMLALDRGLYGLLLLMPGNLDRARQLGLRTLLSVPANGGVSMLSAAQERAVLVRLFEDLPPHRLLNVILSFRTGDEALGIRKTSGGRTRRLVLGTLLGSRKLELWSVKYRRKMREALTHAWGRRMATTLRLILSKGSRDEREERIVHKHVARYRGDNAVDTVLECVAFVLEASRTYTLPLLVARDQARSDLEAGARLPPEVLEGIRSVFHVDTPHGKVLELCCRSGAMSQNQRRLTQRGAAKAGVEVTWDPTRERDAVKLLLYAYERGMSNAVSRQLDRLASRAAAALPVRHEHVGVLLDASASMAGTGLQKLRPLAAAVTLCAVMERCGSRATVAYAGGEVRDDLLRPAGATDLARPLVELLRARPDAIYVISDGYENAPAGRFAEVIEACRRARIELPPVLHLNPVLAAEVHGVRELCPRDDEVLTLPASNPNALGLGMLRALLQSDPVQGVELLLDRVVRKERRLLS